jgi:hypothetical protein
LAYKSPSCFLVLCYISEALSALPGLINERVLSYLVNIRYGQFDAISALVRFWDCRERRYSASRHHRRHKRCYRQHQKYAPHHVLPPSPLVLTPNS